MIVNVTLPRPFCGATGELGRKRFRFRGPEENWGKENWGWFSHLGTTEHYAHTAVAFTDWHAALKELDESATGGAGRPSEPETLPADARDPSQTAAHEPTTDVMDAAELLYEADQIIIVLLLPNLLLLPPSPPLHPPLFSLSAPSRLPLALPRVPSASSLLLLLLLVPLVLPFLWCWFLFVGLAFDGLGTSQFNFSLQGWRHPI